MIYYFILLLIQISLFHSKIEKALSVQIYKAARNKKNDTTSLCLLYQYHNNRILDFYENDIAKKKYGINCDKTQNNFNFSVINDSHIYYSNNVNQSFYIICQEEKETKKENTFYYCGYVFYFQNFMIYCAHIFGNFYIASGFIINFFNLRYKKTSLWLCLVHFMIFMVEEIFNITASQHEYNPSPILMYIIITIIILIIMSVSLFTFQFIKSSYKAFSAFNGVILVYSSLKVLSYLIDKYFIIQWYYTFIGILISLIVFFILSNEGNKVQISMYSTSIFGAYLFIKGNNYLVGGLTNEVLLKTYYQRHKDFELNDKEKQYYITESVLYSYIIAFILFAILGFQHQFRVEMERLSLPDKESTFKDDEFLDVINKEINVFEMSRSVIEDNNTSEILNESVATNRASIQGNIC